MKHVSPWWLFAAILLLFARPVSAQDALPCGEYDATSRGDAGWTITILGPEEASRRYSDGGEAPYLYRRNGNTAKLFDLEHTIGIPYIVSADGKTLTPREKGLGETYVLKRPASCKPPMLPPPGKCRSNIESCYEAGPRTLADKRAACLEGVAEFCRQYIDELRDPTPATADNASTEAPPACKEGTPTFNKAACDELVKQAIDTAFAAGMKEAFSDKPILTAAQLDEIAPLCTTLNMAKVCTEVAKELWAGGRWQQAVEAKQRACAKDRNGSECERLPQIQAAMSKPMQASALQTIPCGTFKSVSGNTLFDDFILGDRGMVTTSMGGQMRARLVAGRLHIRHDKGGDFVLQPLADGRLVGQDTWTEFTVFARDGDAPAQCVPPINYKEAPYVEDCPVTDPAAAKACCDRGTLQGCNTFGNQLALAGKWDQSLPYYQRLCTANIRIGCENLAQIGIRANIPLAKTQLEQLCGSDPERVACDVLETTNWELMGLEQAMEDAVKEIEGKAKSGGKPKPRGKRK